jgi:hypothetical protein
MKFCKIENIGIGDLVIFASEQLSLDEDITVSLDSNSLKSYKSDPDAYLDFGQKLNFCHKKILHLQMIKIYPSIK